MCPQRVLRPENKSVESRLCCCRLPPLPPVPRIMHVAPIRGEREGRDGRRGGMTPDGRRTRQRSEGREGGRTSSSVAKLGLLRLGTSLRNKPTIEGGREDGRGAISHCAQVIGRGRGLRPHCAFAARVGEREGAPLRHRRERETSHRSHCSMGL